MQKRKTFSDAILGMTEEQLRVEACKRKTVLYIAGAKDLVLVHRRDI